MPKYTIDQLTAMFGSNAPPPNEQHRYGYVPRFANTTGVDERMRAMRKAYSTDEPDVAIDNLPVDLAKSAFTWRAVTEGLGIPGQRLPSRNQGNVGSCVGNGGASAGTLTAFCDQIVRGQNEKQPALLSADWAYGIMRTIAGQLGRWDGGTGDWMAEGYQVGGSLSMLKIGDVDLTTYSANRCSQWAMSGVPKSLRPPAEDHQFLQTYKVTKVDRAVALLQAGYGVSICSNFGGGSTRDSDGFMVRPWSTSWSHCMYLAGYRSDKQGVLVVNSWGNDWNSGPIYPDDMPHGSFWLGLNDLQRILGQNDTYAYLGYEGFQVEPPEVPDFFYVP